MPAGAPHTTKIGFVVCCAASMMSRVNGSENVTTAPVIYLTEKKDTMTEAEISAEGQLRGDVTLNFKSETVDLNKLVPQVVDLTRARWADMALQRGAAIDVRTELAASLPPIAAVESQIRDALVNLVFNAVDAMPQGGPLTIRTLIAAGAWKRWP